MTATESVPRLLANITGPADVRRLDPAELPRLAAEIRELLVAKVSATGGHLGPNLGVVELTLALHRVFDSPRDVLVFDTGHQAYVHKILTGRHTGFDGLRQAGGLSGYPSRSESAHDVIENSHASTALSYADGVAKAHALRGRTDRHVVAVVGDGALTGGMCWEALNNIGAAGRPVVVVLNDNTRSYEPTVGGLPKHLTRLRARSAGAPHAPNLFEQLGLDYLGPIDGHDPRGLDQALHAARSLRHPVVVHCVTRKGKGYPPAEQDEADCLHAVGVIDPATGQTAGAANPTWTSVFGQELVAIAHQRPDVVAVTAAMRRPVGLHPFAHAFPDRVFDDGMAEQHAVTSAAGFALGGLHPVVAIYSTFLTRAIDQVLMDVALHQLPVTFVLDRAGITGPDGPSHHGMWDTTLLAAVPGLRTAAPRDPARLRELLGEALRTTDGPTLLRFPKATAGPDIPAIARMDGMDILHRGTGTPLDVLLVAHGVMAAPCLAAADALHQQGIGVTVVDPRWVRPVDPALVHLAARHRYAVTVEDAVRLGGAGTALAQACTDAGVTTPVRNLGLPPAFLPHDTRTALLSTHRLDAEGITHTVTDFLDTARSRRLEGTKP